MRAYLTLYRILAGICRLTAPVTPIVSELFYRALVAANGSDAASVHLESYPKSDSKLIDTELEETMSLVEKIVSLGRAARSRKNLKVRQPLSQILVALPEGCIFDQITDYLPIILSELNVKEVIGVENLDEHVNYSAKLNFKTAGPKLGARVKKAATLLAGMPSESISQLAATGELKLDIEGDTIILTEGEVLISRDEKENFAVESEGSVTVALVTELNDDLIDEGFARELVNKIQNMRKNGGLEVTDRIAVRLTTTEIVHKAVQRHDDFIRRETLADQIEFAGDDIDNAKEWSINGEKTTIAVAKVQSLAE